MRHVGTGRLIRRVSPSLVKARVRQTAAVIFAALASFVAVAAPGGIWLDVPFVKQEKNGCGAASASMLLQYWARQFPQLKVETSERVFQALYSPEEKGVPAPDLERYLEESGFDTHTLKATWRDLDLHLSRGRPLILALSEGSGDLHYVVAVGLDRQRHVILLNDPARGSHVPFSRENFQMAWEKAGAWALLALPAATLRESGTGAAEEVSAASLPGLSSEAPGDFSREDNYLLGLELARDGRWRQANDAFRRGREENPSDARYLHGLAGVAMRRNDPASARRHLEKALSLDPEDEYAHHFLGSLHYLEDNLEAAVKTWNRAGRPRLEGLQMDLPSGVNAVLVERALRVAPGVLRWEDLLYSQALIENLKIFANSRFDLVAREGGSFGLRFQGSRQSSPFSSGLTGIAPFLAGLPFRTARLSFYDLDGAGLNLSSSLRWHPYRRQLYSSISGLLKGDPAWRYRFHFRGRQEQWNVNHSAGENFLGEGEFPVETIGAGFELLSVPAARWKWSSGVTLAHRNFEISEDPTLFSSGWLLKHQSAVEHDWLRVPEKGLTGSWMGRGELGGRPGGDRSLYSRLSGSLRLRWSVGTSYRVSGAVKGGAAWGAVPFDELFQLGLHEDNDLWMRAHPGTRAGRKGSAPMGTRFLLVNWELDRKVYEKGMLAFWAGPFLDSGRIFDPSGRFGVNEWLWDTGLQLKVTGFGGAALILSGGRNLRTGQTILYATLSH